MYSSKRVVIFLFLVLALQSVSKESYPEGCSSCASDGTCTECISGYSLLKGKFCYCTTEEGTYRNVVPEIDVKVILRC